MSVSSGSDVTIPIQDSPPPPPSPYANRNGEETASKTPEPRGDVIVNTGIDNDAYQMESKDDKDSKDSHNTQITMNGTGGDAQPPLNEAVNSELINLNILNTIPDKPQPEFGPYDNFDEYFIPVNQHKKFLRSEKLYVTKDKRKQSQWKKYICWLIGAFILAAIVTVAVLAGVGLIPQKSANSFVTDSVVGTTPDFTSPSSTTENRLTPALSTSTSTEYITTTTTTSPPALPQDDTYVPNTADVEFTLTDLQYEAALNDRTTDRFRELASEIEQEMKLVLKRDSNLESTFARVIQFAPGSVHTKMRIGWVDDKANVNDIKMNLAKMTTFGTHTLMALASFGVVNHCKFANNGCSNFCTFDYESLDFLCTCPELMLLDTDKKMCNNITAPTPESSPETEQETSPDTESSDNEPHPTDAPEVVSVSQRDEDNVPVPITPETIQEPVSSSVAPEVSHEEEAEHQHEVSSSVAPESEHPVVSSEAPAQENSSPVEEHSHSPAPVSEEPAASEEPVVSEESIAPQEQQPSPSIEPESESGAVIPIGAVTTTEKAVEGETNIEEENTNPTNPTDIGDHSEAVQTEPESQPPSVQEETHETPIETTVTTVEETKVPESEGTGLTNATEVETEPEVTVSPEESENLPSSSSTEVPVVVSESEKEPVTPETSNLEVTHEETIPLTPMTTSTTTAAPEPASASQEDEGSASSEDSTSTSLEGETTIHPENVQEQSLFEAEEVPQGRRSKSARHDTAEETPEEVVAETEKTILSSSPSTSSEFMVFGDNGQASQSSSNTESGATTDSTQNDSVENASNISGSVENTGSASVESKKEDLSLDPEVEVATTSIPPPSLINDTMVNEQSEQVTEDASNTETVIAENPNPASPSPTLEKLVEATTVSDVQDDEQDSNTQSSVAPVLTTSTTEAPAPVADVETASSDEASEVKAPEEQEQSSTEIPSSDPLFSITTTNPSTTTNSSQPLSTTIKIITPQSFGNEYETENISESASDESNTSQQDHEPTGLDNDL